MQHAAIDFRNAAPVIGLKTTYLNTLDLSIVDASFDATIDALLSNGRQRVHFMNAHCCNVMQRDHAYAMAVRTADILLPDGIGVALAAKMDGKALAANLNGTDLVPALLAKAATQGKSVFLFGGTPGTAEKAARTLATKIPGLRIAGTRDGYEGAQNDEAAIAAINASGADIVLVALGVPQQEIWLHRNAHRLDAPLSFGVGALFDFLAGNVSRAPAFVRKARCEWVWRLANEPARLANRYLVGNATFMARAARKAVSPARMARRFLDVSVAASALVLLSPLFLLTALAIRVESKGPVFFHQTRVGKNGVPFQMIKFRSMVQNAEDLRATLLDTSDRDGICFKSRNDPRITRIGRFIRRASIDELPQVWNVLRGEMSIVGPRPALPSEVAAYPARAYGRLAVKPGITGVWQVSGRADIGFDQMVDMDLAYASKRTVLLDVIIILLTFRAVVSGRGAH
ncbi:WecB/TagA/CpsF family glycosyltransferase [Cognatishimia sp. F0-27]|uniref:WecB/TagA/CpsF family glycosyltransferase n=1 Tax=Cognatishimia sp. F0-27 TaxID=2816855 RepID=UPI001D0C00BB|nr:WecB/TagA/CpsF family glycosyltransferase [Cognatishimia sp. F0-27]MCC1493853.1 WecB/TagA/CpsF family glycosyltransferase [Cognatishimia sp. F0-27]